MTFVIRPLEGYDLYGLIQDVAEEHAKPYLTDIDFSQLSDGFIGLLDGEPVGCAGLNPIYGHSLVRAVAWALFYPRAGEVFISIHRAIRRYLINSPYRRIEAHCDAGFSSANRLCELLGFTLEAEGLKCWFPNGASANQWCILK